MKHFKSFAFILFAAVLTAPVFAANYPAPSDVVKTYFAAVDNGSDIGNLLADDMWANVPFSPQPINKQGWAGTMQAFKTAFPDMKHQVLEIIESGNKVAVRGLFTGQNNGPMMGNPATGNRVNAPFNAIIELDKSWKIKSITSMFDMKSFEAQLAAGLPDADASAEATVRAMLTAADEGNVDKFMSYWTPDGINYFAGRQTSGEDMKKRIAGFKAGFPDIKRVLDEVIVKGDKVTVRGWVTGTNAGNFRGQAPTGNSIKIAWLGLYKLDKSGKIVEGWVEFDTANLDSQLAGKTMGKGK